MITATKLPFLLRLLQPVEFPHKLGIMERIFGSHLERNGICWVRTGAGRVWKLDLGNSTHRWIIYGKYEGAPFLDWAKNSLPVDGVVVDSGANIGQMLLYLAQWIPKGKLLAIEPGKHQADWLAECLNVYSDLPIELIRAGLGASHRTARLKETGGPDRHGSCNQINDTDGEVIELTTLGEILEQRQISKVDLWKLDVEGFEIPALEGARPLLESHRIRALFVELHRDNGRAIREFLERLGYQCWLFKANGKLFLPAALPEHTNGLFLPRSGSI